MYLAIIHELKISRAVLVRVCAFVKLSHFAFYFIAHLHLSVASQPLKISNFMLILERHLGSYGLSENSFLSITKKCSLIRLYVCELFLNAESSNSLSKRTTLLKLQVYLQSLHKTLKIIFEKWTLCNF